MKTKYRIVLDNYCGFEAQVKYWFFPFWIQFKGSNTHFSVEGAERYIAHHRFVKNVE